MTKREMALEIAKLSGAPEIDFASIVRHQMHRPIADVRDSLSRQRAIAGVSRGEIARHCQPYKIHK